MLFTPSVHFISGSLLSLTPHTSSPLSPVLPLSMPKPLVIGGIKPLILFGIGIAYGPDVQGTALYTSW